MSDPTEALPVGAYVASALMAANYPGDSGEDVDRFLAELDKRGYRVTRAASEDDLRDHEWCVPHDHVDHTGDVTGYIHPAAPAEGLGVAERRRLAGALANWALSPGESFRTLLPYLDLTYEEAYREGWMVFTNAINERLTRAEAAPAEGHKHEWDYDQNEELYCMTCLPAAPAEGPDVERLAKALCRRAEYVWANERDEERDNWRDEARAVLAAAALEANHE